MSVYVITHPLLSSQVLASLSHVFLGVLLRYLLAILVRFLALLEAYYKVFFASRLEGGRRFCLRCTEILWLNSLHKAELSIGIGDWRRLGTQRVQFLGALLLIKLGYLKRAIVLREHAKYLAG